MVPARQAKTGGGHARTAELHGADRLESKPPEFIARDRSVHPPAFTPDYKTSVLRSPRLPLLSLQNSLSEVTGPVFGHSEIGPLDNDLILNYAKDGEAIGPRIIVHGQVLDQNGRGVPHVLIEFWQANAVGAIAIATIATSRRSTRISAAAAVR